MSGFTVVPRWTLNPEPGAGLWEARAAEALVSELHRLATDLAVPLSSVLLTAHAKVLSALSGESEVESGYAVNGGSPSPLRPTLMATSTLVHLHPAQPPRRCR